MMLSLYSLRYLLMTSIEYIVKKALLDDWLLRTHGLRLSGENLSKLLYAATRDQLFSHNGHLYEQFEGVAMGSPLGPLMANACMCMLEEKLVQDGRMPSFYRRYVDDTLAIFPSHEAHENFFAHLNTLHPSIRFTAELAENGILPFIGVNCHLDSSGVQTSVYHKPTDTGLLLHFHSHVDQKYKHSLLRTMIHRAYKISSSWQHLHGELSRIRATFTSLQYPRSLIDLMVRRVISDSLRPGPRPTDQSPMTRNTSRFILPYKSKELSTSLRADLTSLNKRLDVNISPVFVSSKVRDLIKPSLTPVGPDKIVSQSKVVYNYRCSCDMGYIGYTNRHLHQRIAEHTRPASSIFQHCASTGHEFRESGFKVIAKCKTKLDCMIRESHEIHFRHPTLNSRDEYMCSLLYRLRV